VEHYRREKVVVLARQSVSWSVLAASVLAACATPGESQPVVNVAPVPEATKPEAVSFFGIFRNGRMSPEAWEDFGKVLSTPFSHGICKAAYDIIFTDADPQLADAIDDYAKENGVSDELLEKFAPLSQGDTILLIAMDGQLPKLAASPEKASKPTQDPASSGSGQGNYGGSGASQGGAGPGGSRGMGHGGGGRGGMGGRRGQSGPAPQPKSDKGSWELTAFLYSVRLHKSTGQVDLKQQGQDIDGDLKLFAAKLGTEIPGVPCRGWDRGIKVDAEAVRKLAEP